MHQEIQAEDCCDFFKTISQDEDDEDDDDKDVKNLKLETQEVASRVCSRNLSHVKSFTGHQA